MMTLLVAVLTVFVSCGAVDYWPISTRINETHVPVYVTNNNNRATALRPQERRSFPDQGFAQQGPAGPGPYVIKAYEFLPGKGDLLGWYEEWGTVLGGQGDLLFCITYPQEEIEAMNYVVTITPNVSPGNPPPDCLP
jgi:hypothetical protein